MRVWKLLSLSLVEPCRDFGRAALLCRFDVKAVRQHSPTEKLFMALMRVQSLEIYPLHEPCDRRAAFMPLQCDICEGIRIVPMLLDMPALRRNKFRDPRFIFTKHAKFRKGAPHDRNWQRSEVPMGKCSGFTLN